MTLQSAAGDSRPEPCAAGTGGAVSIDPLTADVVDIFEAIDLPVIVVNMDCVVARFNRAAATMLSLTPADIGHPFGHIQILANQPHLQTLCARVNAGGAPGRLEVRDGDKRFLVRIAAYPGSERPVLGAVLTFMNMTAFRASIEQAIYEREFTKAILNTVTEPLAVLDADLRMQTANRAFFTLFGISREETQGRRLTELKHHEWDTPGLWTAAEGVPVRQ